MKILKKIFARFRPIQRSALALYLLAGIMSINGFSQTGSPERIAPIIDFSAVQKNDNTIDLKTSLKAKINGSLVKLYGMKISFITADSASGKALGTIISDRNGVALLNYKTNQLIPDKEGKFHFKAVFDGNNSLEAAEEELSVKKAILTIAPVKEDSVLSVKLRLSDLSAATETAIPETDLTVYVKRLFKPLKIGEAKTDENGEAVVEIPGGLPGDAKGNITLLARVEDNEQYGNLEAAATQPWGTPVSDKIEKLPRALWSPNPPLWMLVTFIILVAAVWGHYIVIVYELFRLRHDHPKKTDNQSSIKI